MMQAPFQPLARLFTNTLLTDGNYQNIRAFRHYLVDLITLALKCTQLKKAVSLTVSGSFFRRTVNFSYE
jgi:hypothetical protein